MISLRRILFTCFLAVLIPSVSVAQKTADKEDTKTEKVETKDEKKESSEKEDAKKDAQEDSKKSSKKEKKKPQLRQISLSGNYVDLVTPLSFDPTSMLLGANPTKQRSFYKLCKFIDDLAEDDRFQYVLFDLSDSNLSMNLAQLEELSRHIKKLSDANKRTYAWLENASNDHLAIAACCDEVVIADFGGIDMPSLAMQSMFYRDAMDLVGVKASVVRAGDFKGAVEPYTNARMSDHLREHYMKMLESMNDASSDLIARGRGLKPSKIRELQSKRILLPADALAAGLVDALAPFGSMEETIKDDIGEDIEWVTAKAAAKRQTSVFQLMSQMMAGPQSGGRIRSNSILVLHLSGAIVDGKKAAGGNIVSGPTVELIEKIIDEDKVKGVVVRINSPGGSATASEAIRQALVKLAEKKPTVVSMGNMAASGGYWISCIDAPVYAEKGTLTGSIGVFSMKLSMGALMRRVGIHLESMMLDESAGVFAMDRPWSEKDTETLQGHVDMVYDRFFDLVSESRDIKKKKLRKLAGGRVWSGAQAKQNKLVDHIGGVDDCLEIVAKKANLDDYYVVHRPIAKSGLDLSDLLGSGGEEEIWESASRVALQMLRKRGLSLETTQLMLQDGLNNRGRPRTWLMNPVELSIH